MLSFNSADNTEWKQANPYDKTETETIIAMDVNWNQFLQAHKPLANHFKSFPITSQVEQSSWMEPLLGAHPRTPLAHAWTYVMQHKSNETHVGIEELQSISYKITLFISCRIMPHNNDALLVSLFFKWEFKLPSIKQETNWFQLHMWPALEHVFKHLHGYSWFWHARILSGSLHAFPSTPQGLNM